MGVGPTLLGRYPHDCVGNMHHCPDGFTVSLYYNPKASDPEIPHRYILSSGGQSPMSEGFYFRQNYGREHEIGVAKDTTLWSVTFFLLENEDALVLFTWNDTLRAYVDGIPIGDDLHGSDRLFTAPEFDLFPEIIVGKANTDIRSDDTFGEVKVAEVDIKAGVHPRKYKYNFNIQYIDMYIIHHMGWGQFWWYTLRNVGSLTALKEPLWFFCETRGSFDGVGFF